MTTPSALRRTLCRAFLVACMVHMAVPSLLTAQTTDRDLAAIATWVAVDSATGYEGRTSPALAAALGNGWTSDAWGNVVTTVGTGSPHRIVACALDRPSYAVSEITHDGYLRVHRIGRGASHPLWDQQFEAQQVRVLTRSGPVAGVVARSNGHFAPQHAKDPVVTADDVWVDVGASSRADVEAMGIALLDPLSRQLPPWPMAGGVAGPDAGRRVGCAAVVAAAAAARLGGTPGRTTFVLSAQQVTGWIGLSSRIARDQKVESVTVLAPGEQARAESDMPSAKLGSFGAVLLASGLSAVHWIVPAVDQAGSHMEVVRGNEAQWLADAASKGAGLNAGHPLTWLPAPAPAPLHHIAVEGTLTAVESLLSNLVDRYGVSGHEWSVRRAVLEALPTWARDLAVVDDMGNIVVEVGPQGPPTVFMAHMDEVGFVIESIASDGTVSLTPRGGAVGSAWEGQTALVHFDPAGAPSSTTGHGVDTDPQWKRSSLAASAPDPLRGVFRVRATAGQKSPGPAQAWFGLDAQALAARGVSVGMQVTSYKQGVRLGRTRFTARSEDDRAGTTALLRAVNQIDPARVPGRLIFAWSVAEETGLDGATAMARRFGARTARIYSLDTFVSSDTPLESHHFAYAPLGGGPVFRAIENSNVSPDAERQRVQRIAAAAGIPLQMGLTQGGTDGSSFTFWGAPNQGLSWPGRYSHSPGEVLDLRDLDALGRLIVAVAMTPDR